MHHDSCCTHIKTVFNVARKNLNAEFTLEEHFLKSHSVVYQIRTQCHQEMESEALDFINPVCPKVIDIHCCPKFIINMDQTPISFLFHGKKILSKMGVKALTAKKSMSDTMRATFALPVTASRKRFTPMLIYMMKAVDNNIQDLRVELFTFLVVVLAYATCHHQNQ